MLCKPMVDESVLRNAFMMGAVATSLPIPILSDIFGRKMFFEVIFVITLIILFVIYLMTSYDWAIFLMGALGATLPGRVIVGRIFYIEYTNPSKLDFLMMIMLVMQPLAVFFIAFYFQFISKHIEEIQLNFIIIGVFMALFILVFVPESPKFLYNKGKHSEARDTLRAVASFNEIKNPDENDE